MLVSLVHHMPFKPYYLLHIEWLVIMYTMKIWFTFQAKDSTLLYGVCQTLVNLTNTFDKPDIPDEMKQLGEFAKVKLPKFHEKVML